MGIYGTSLIKESRQIKLNTAEDVNDFIVEYCLDGGNYLCCSEQALLEGANSDITDEIKSLGSKLKEEIKGMSQAKKELDVNKVKKHAANINKLTAESRKVIKSIDSNVGEAIIGYILSSFFACLKNIVALIVVYTPIIGPLGFSAMSLEGAARTIEEYKNFIEDIATGDINVSTFNKYRNRALGLIDEIERVSDWCAKVTVKYIENKKNKK